MLSSDRGHSFYEGYLLAREIIQWAGSKSGKKFGVFLPSSEIYGIDEISDSYLNSKRLFLEKIKELPKRNLQPKIVFPETFVNGKIPKSYYDFKAKKSFIFHFGGDEVNKYIDRIYV